MTEEHLLEPTGFTGEHARFNELLAGSYCYLEYGCGGSTVISAFRFVDRFCFFAG